MTSTRKYSQVELMRLIKKRDKSAFNFLYDLYSGALYGIVLKILQNDEERAQCVFEESYLRIWKEIDSFDPAKGTLFTWMLNIMRKSAIEKCRMTKTNTIQPVNSNVDNSGNQHYYNVVQEKVEKKELKDKRKQENKSIFDMVFYDGYTPHEISEVLNIPIEKVKAETRSALNKKAEYQK